MNLGVAIAIVPLISSSFTDELIRYWPSLIGALIATFSFFYLFWDTFRRQLNRPEQRFVDVDESAQRTDRRSTKEVVEKIEKLLEQHTPIDADRLRELIAEQPLQRASDPRAFSNFVSYFRVLSYALEEKAALADKKASILLDKGTKYSWWGFAFFVLSIVAWQIFMATTEFQIQHVYGIVSCSLLFGFLEFYSAWFLRQYRHFVDTSTYLIKVKSIFDRYLLAFLIAKERGAFSQDANPKLLSALLRMLSADIKWPDGELWRRGDISFAREAIDSMSKVIDSVVSRRRRSASKQNEPKKS
jgi:hypothetical protein